MTTKWKPKLRPCATITDGTRRRVSIRVVSFHVRFSIIILLWVTTTTFLQVSAAENLNKSLKDPPRGGGSSSSSQTPLIVNPIQAFVATVSDAKSHLVAAAVVGRMLIFCICVYSVFCFLSPKTSNRVWYPSYDPVDLN
jgi:hypothetical protein